MEPTRERIVPLDALRGFALFGILMVNIGVFSGPWPLRTDDPWTGFWDQLAYRLVDALFANKFFPTFSLLFGAGFGLQMQRVSSAGADFARLWRRRMGGLLAIGLVHAALLSTIDILVQYAALGMLLYALRNARDRTLLTIAAVMLLLPIGFMAGAVAVGEAANFTGVSPDEARRMIHGYASGDVHAFFVQRTRDLVGYYFWVIFYAGYPIVAMFLTGYVAARRGIVRDLAAHRDTLKRIFVIALPIALVATTARLALDHSLMRAPTVHPWRWVLHSALQMCGDPALCISYVTGLALLFLQPRAASITNALAPMGRTALSQYVLQSVVMSVVFFAARRYGTVSPATALAMGVALYLLQIALALAWARRFRQGPLEALWRRWTYFSPSRPSLRSPVSRPAD